MPWYLDWLGDGFGLEVHARRNVGRAPHMFVAAAQITLDLDATAAGIGVCDG